MKDRNRQVPTNELCLECSGPLTPARSAPDKLPIPAGADCVCVACGQSYEWVGTPPTLMPAARVPKTWKVEIV